MVKKKWLKQLFSHTVAEVTVRVRQTVGWSAAAAAAAEREGNRELLVGVEAAAEQSSEGLQMIT